MKVIVDRDLCQANAVCVRECPEVFRVEEDDMPTLLIEEVPVQHRAAVEQAVRLCPRQALRLES